MSDPATERTPVRFEATYSPLGDSAASLGRVAVLPWDGEIFGFRVGDYAPGGTTSLVAHAGELPSYLAEWAERERVDIVGCRVGTRPAALGAVLESAGFRFIEIQLRATIPRLRPADFRPSRLTVRSAEGADQVRIAEIAGAAFTLGRYHADPRFPRALADRRYRVWMERVFDAPAPGTWVGVVGSVGSPGGFLHAEIASGVADIRLAAVDRDAAGIAGPELFRGAVHEFAARGVHSVTARISAVNSGVLNIYASLGFRFHEPEIVFHWHRPAAPGLLSLAESLEQSREADGPQRAR